VVSFTLPRAWSDNRSRGETLGEVTKPWENDPDGGSFGSWLRRQREVREITLREISQESKISLRYLEAIEQDKKGVLPAPVFVRGFLREYARFVGLDPDEVINYHMASVPKKEADDDAAPSRGSDRPTMVRPIWLVAALVAVLAVIGGFSYFSRSRGPESNAMVPPQGATLPQTPMAEDLETPAPIRLAMDFTQTSWVAVTIDGERAISELRVQGESLRVEAERELRIRLGNVGGVSFELNGEPFQTDVADDEELVIDLTRVGGPDNAEEATGPPSGS
jgi:transcriptional regulator with XRE-family HTH domain